MIYLDNSATTQTDADVIKVMADVMANVYGNPSSLHGLGVKAERLMEQARKIIAQELAASPQEIIFTSGGTEANNMAIKGVAEAYQHRGKHIITTELEHPSVYDTCKQLEQRGWRISMLPVDHLGRVSPELVEQSITEDTVLVSVMHVNNEIGTVQPISEIGKRLRRYPKVLFHVDAVQSFAKFPIYPEQWGIDLLSVSGHKFHGPKGIGCLYKRKNLQLTPLLAGGGQEQALRSGTQNLPGIVGLAKATALAGKQRDAFMERCRAWKEWLIQRITAEIKGVRVNGDVTGNGGAPYILSLSFPGLKSEVIVHALEQEGVVVSSKSACSSKKEVPSRVLKAIGLEDEAAVGSIRISMGLMTTEEEVRHAADALLKVIPSLQQVIKVRKR
ncbi:cysteine desulfurase NifS [Laceyella sacchari]|uniref:Cysteine desulfurase n=2 Tax=Laceyella TaxID=292635 RepID=A0AA45WLS6_9BACL|nr:MULTISPECIES: cysteine desulfurase family protein [Laceyella]AUS09415.1 cysteine desulfurase NifS [Laceyella sacchari]PRZ17080.1 cysteine desulfurase [Laceyella sediminis]SMP12059.1 cysteine desulfurase [Laceyella tengchongensis]